MGGSGFAIDMIRRFNSNRQLQRERHFNYKKVKEAYQKAEMKHKPFLSHDKLSQDQLKLLKNKIRKDVIKDRRKSLWLTIAITSLILLLLATILITVRL
jgi:hypothetical protein